MGEFYYFNERSTALKVIRNYGICEDTVIPFIDDEIHNKYDKSYKYLFSVKKNFRVPSKSLIWLTETMQQFFAKQS